MLYNIGRNEKLVNDPSVTGKGLKGVLLIEKIQLIFELKKKELEKNLCTKILHVF